MKSNIIRTEFIIRLRLGFLSDKIGQALDDKRQSVATDWLNAGDEMQATKDAAVLTANTAEVETPAPVEVDQGGEQADDVPAVQD